MPPDELAKFPHDFVKKLDAGGFDGHLFEELRKLSKEQTEELAQILAERRSF